MFVSSWKKSFGFNCSENNFEDEKEFVIEKDRVERLQKFLGGFTTRTKIIEDSFGQRTMVTVTLGLRVGADGAVPFELRINRREPEVEREVYVLSGVDGSIVSGEWFGGTGRWGMPGSRRGWFEREVVEGWLGKLG